jgi:antitoxin (DNA-binding transcriptional repressor) of toxin-antitoxin stability system
MVDITLTELRQKAGQLATRAARGERFGVVLNGLVVAVLGPAPAPDEATAEPDGEIALV